MFKPGDTALVVATGKLVSVQNATLSVVETVDADGCLGGYLEAELRQGHPTVLETANPKETSFLKSSEVHEEVTPEAAQAVIEKTEALLKKLDLSDDLQSLFNEANLKVDLRGHWKNEPWYGERIQEDLLYGAFRYIDDPEELKAALISKKPMDRWVNLGLCTFGAVQGCSYCGSKKFQVETNGVEIRLTGEPCPLPNGFEPNEWELNVPSGKIVVANDLRQWFPLPTGDDDIESINSIMGRRQTAQAYAEVGLSHAFVGNTCPGVFKTGDSSFKIANAPSEEEWNGEEYVERKNLPTFEGERVAGICTDLWWYSICDADEFARRVEKFGDAHKEDTIEVRPGVYRFRHDDEASQRDSDDENVYTTFEWVREADPVQDFLKSWNAVEVNPHAYVQAQVRQWPTLYGAVEGAYGPDERVVPWSDMTPEQKEYSWVRVADQVFCTIGGGVEWHEKGFPLGRVDSTVPDIEPPSFRQQHSWYPFSKNYGGLFRVGTLTPSFAKLAFRVLESVISFGMHVHDNSHSRDVVYVRERMLTAVERYRELAQQYPEQADSNYVAWLAQPGRAEAWVARFDLGPIYTEKHAKNAEAQRWVPADAYAIEFDARKLEEGTFAWATGTWAHKKDAARYVIKEWSDNDQPDPRQNCFWSGHAKNTAIPLYSVARVVKVGDVSHMGETLVELAFDYGTEWMTDPSKRKAVSEQKEKDAIRVLTKEEYEKLLPKAKAFKLRKKTTKAAKKTTKKPAKKAR